SPALLVDRRPCDRRCNAGAERDQYIVASCMKQRRVELPVALPPLLRSQRIAPHVGEACLHHLEVVTSAPLRRESGCSGLDDTAQLEQAVDQLPVRLSCEGPSEDVGVEQVPAVARQDARPGFWPALDQALRNKHLNGFPVGSARYAKRVCRHRFGRQGGAGWVIAGKNVGAELAGDRAVKPSPRAMTSRAS